MELAVRIISRKTDKAIRVLLENWRLVWIPIEFLERDYQIGERHLIVECRDGAWAKGLTKKEKGEKDV